MNSVSIVLYATHLTGCSTIIMASYNPKMSIEGTAGKQKCVTLNPQKLEIIKRHESGKNQREIMASYSFGSSAISYAKKRKDQLSSFVAFSESVKDLFRQEKLKEPKLVQMDNVLTVMHFEAKPITGPVVIEKS